MRCQFHLQQNAQQYVTKQNLKTNVADHIRTIFYAMDKAHAEESLKNFAKSTLKLSPNSPLGQKKNLP
jgi:hypothetical protein